MESYDAVVIAGTTEAAQVIAALEQHNMKVLATVATELGREVLKGLHCHVHTGRMDLEAFQEMFRITGVPLVVDASHPFAAVVSRTVKEACKYTGAKYLRYLRKDCGYDYTRIFYVDSAKEAAALAASMEGNILLTTGANTAAVYKEKIHDFNRRVFIRVLDTEFSRLRCEEAGIDNRHVIAKNPPFSVEDNLDILEAFGIRLLVSKDSGASGGVFEKIESARRMGIPVILIRKPDQEEGVFSIEELLKSIGGI